MRVRFFDIRWDTSSDDTEGTRPDLPSECVLDVDDDLIRRRQEPTC